MQKRIAKYGVASDYNSALNADKKTYHVMMSSPLTKTEQRAGAASVAGGTYLHLISVL